MQSHILDADLAHLVERHLAKVEVASSSLVIRSIALYYLFHCGRCELILQRLFLFEKKGETVETASPFC